MSFIEVMTKILHGNLIEVEWVERCNMKVISDMFKARRNINENTRKTSRRIGAVGRFLIKIYLMDL